MNKKLQKILCICLTVIMVAYCVPVVSVYAHSVIEIFDEKSVHITEKLYLTEYRTQQLQALVPTENEDGTVVGTAVDTSDGSYIVWESNLPLLAGVDDGGVVTAYDFSKTAIIRLWIDENIRTMPLVGDATADAIWEAFESSGIDLDSASTDTIVAVVTGIAGEALGESLRTYLDNMNVVITATLYDASGNALGSDSVEYVIEKSVVASVAPTGVHITNKKVVPTTVAVGASVQLYGAVTPVRLEQGVKWSMGSSAFDTNSADYASVSEDGLVTFSAAGTATVRVNPESSVYAAFSDTITFNIVEASELPITYFEVSGEKSVAEGATIQLAIDNVEPVGAYQGDLVWSTSDPTIAVVDESGVVTGLDGGSGLTEYSKSVVITATMGGMSVDYEISVTRSLLNTSISSVEISGDEILGIDAGGQYTATVYPSRLNTSSSVSRQWGVINAVTGEYIPATSDSNAEDGVVSVSSDGYVTATGAGVATIYCTASYGSSSATGTYQIVCGKAITDFEISGSTSLSEGDTSQLSINVLAPDDYETSLLEMVKWSVDDDTVATVSEDGLLLGRDAGGRNSSRTTTVYATVSGITKSVTVTVSRGWLNLSKYTDGQVEGPDYVIVDVPHSFTLKTYPESLSQTASYWAIINDDGSAPWSVSNTYSGGNRNTENTYASISDDGTVTGKTAGTTTVYGFARYLLQSHVERTKEIEIIEIAPESITLKAPDKVEYLEGDTELDLTGLEVYLNYSKESLKPYYSDWESYTDDMLTCQVADYEISEVSFDVLDTSQYVIVSVDRAGKTYNAVFAVTVNSKQVESIDVVPPEKTVYVEGEEIDLTGLEVIANYANADSESITDYEIDYTSFSMDVFDVEQQVRVFYEHEGRSAEAYFPIIVYGKPVLTVEVDGVVGEWTSEDITFTLSSTHELDGATYYRKTGENGSWVRVDKGEFTLAANIDNVIYFKAINSLGYESNISEGFIIKRDNVTPAFSLSRSVSVVTNEDYEVNIDNLTYGVSGIKSVTVNGEEISFYESFTVSQNGEYNVVITSNSGLSSESSIEISNIDKETPGITGITVVHEPEDAPERHLDGELGNYYSGNLFAYASAEDSGVAGVDYIKYRLVDASYEPVADWITVSDEVVAVCDSNFKGYFEFVAVDKAGNESSSEYSDGFVRDSVKPVITGLNPVYGNKEYTSDIWADDVVSFTPEADAFSGVYEILYKIDDGEWKTISGNSVEEKRDGSFTYSFKAISYSGLESDVTQFVANVDRTVPLIRVEMSGTIGQWTSENVKFTLSTLNECPSGCTYYYNDGTGWYAIDGDVLVLDDSTNTFYSFKVINGAGLESATSDAYKVMIDNEVPTGYIIPAVTVNTDTPYEVAIVPQAGESGYLKVYFNGEDVTETLKATVSENGKYALTVIGSNLLSSTVMVEISNFSAIPASLFSYAPIDDETLTVTLYNGEAQNVTIPLEIDGLETISVSDGAFENKTSVVTVNVPNTAESIGENCFAGCISLQKITIPASVTEIAESAFDECENVTIYCYESSYAQSYAEENGIPYVLLDLTPVGKTVINETAGVIFTYQSCKTAVEEIVKAGDDYTVFAIPSFVGGSNNYYGTGSIFYFFRNGSLAYTYNVVVYGDVNGDSVIDVLDASHTEKAVSGNFVLESYYLMAADFNSDGAVEATDYQQIVNVCLR